MKKIFTLAFLDRSICYKYSMNYKLIKDITDTWFYKFLPGKYYDKRKFGKCNRIQKFDNNSVYMSSEAIYLIGDCLHIANNGFNKEITIYSKKKDQIKLLREQLLIRYKEINDGKDFSGKFSPEINNDLIKYKEEILIMIQELITWIDEIKEDVLTIVGTQDKFADWILGN